jgi:hypothetical protein
MPWYIYSPLEQQKSMNISEGCFVFFFREGAFWGLSKLTRLSLYDNKMTHIESGAFDGLTK